jgi:3'-5' exoribonuclease Rv2179c-like domain
MSQVRNIMIDLETLGVRPGCVILSVGAAEFSTLAPSDGIFRTYYRIINTDSCLAAGLTEEDKTLEWWMKQDEKMIVKDAADSGVMLASVLAELFIWIGDGAYVWGNGASFDLPILAEAYHRCGFGGPPWKPGRDRCYRTLKNLYPNIPLNQMNTHNAVADAANQARHAVRILRSLEAPLQTAFYSTGYGEGDRSGSSLTSSQGTGLAESARVAAGGGGAEGVVVPVEKEGKIASPSATDRTTDRGYGGGGAFGRSVAGNHPGTRTTDHSRDPG